MIEEEKGTEKESERDSPFSLPQMAMKSGPDQRKTTSQKLYPSLLNQGSCGMLVLKAAG